MSSYKLREGDDYQNLFNPQDYLGAYYKQPEGPVFIEFVLDSLHEIYRQGNITGRRLVDIGSGPTIHMVIPAAKWFDEVYVSDFSKRNREAQENWLNNDSSAHNWEPFFRYFAKKDGNEERWREYEEELRRKIKAVMTCDVHDKKPIPTGSGGEFDVVCTSLCLEPSSSDYEQYSSSMKNVVSLVRSGGYFVLMGVLNNPFYTVGSEKFHCLAIKLPAVLQSVKDSGLEVLQLFEDNRKLEGDVAPYDGAFVLLARKL